MLPGTWVRFLTPSPENTPQEGGPRSTHLSCGLVSSSGSLGVRLAATRRPASPQTDPAGSRPAATANCACASGRAGGCGLRWRPQGASEPPAQPPLGTQRPRAWGGVAGTRGRGDAVLPTSVSPSLELRLQALPTALLGSSCRALIGSRMDDEWMDGVFWFFVFVFFLLLCSDDPELLDPPSPTS